jgi:hypothetical protein
MEDIPNGPADMTWAWFQTVTDWSVDDVRVEQIGVGIGVSSTLYRAHLQGTGCPGTVIVKLAALDDAAVYTATALGLYRREVLFFAELAAECPVRVPESYFSEINEDGSAFVIVMEDLGENRMVDQVAGIGLADAERAVDHLAEWHATWWNRVEGFSERGLSVPLGSPLYPAVLPGLFAEGWAKLEAEAPHVLEAVVDVGPKFGAAIEPLLQQLDQSPISLLHGDFRADNMLFDANDELMMLDFQITGTGSAVYDLAYFVTQSLDAEPRLGKPSEPVRSVVGQGARTSSRCRTRQNVGRLSCRCRVLHHLPGRRVARHGPGRPPPARACRDDDGSYGSGVHGARLNPAARLIAASRLGVVRRPGEHCNARCDASIE